MPKTNVAYWRSKIARNVEREAENLNDLAELGWKTLTVWECEIKADLDRLRERVERFLG